MELTRVAHGPPDTVAARHVADRHEAGFDAALESTAVKTSTALDREVDAAWRRGAELQAQGRQLHFRRDENSGRVVIEVRDLEGNVLRRIPPTDALAVLAGKRPD